MNLTYLLIPKRLKIGENLGRIDYIRQQVKAQEFLMIELRHR